jgi:hypothetical protein
VDAPGFNTFSPSLDRIDPSRGYIPGNVQVISNRANLLKRDGTLREIVLLGRWATEQLRREHMASKTAPKLPDGASRRKPAQTQRNKK